MATAILDSRRMHSEAERFQPDPSHQEMTPGPLVVAVDGTVRSDAALRAARAVAALTNRKVLVLTVHVPLPMLGPEVELAASPSAEAESRKGQFLQVLDQLERVGITEPWPVKVTTGYPAATIAKLARNVDASLIIMGLGGHGVIDRIFGDEMVLQVLRIGTVPVLAVADTFDGLPKTALAAIDFSASSQRALELGAALVRDEHASLTLAHVLPTESEEADARHENKRRDDVRRALWEVSAAVGLTGAREARVASGDPATRLLETARALQADLIITGSHGHNFLSRLLLGSVSTRLLRKAGCSILIAPPVDEPAVEEELPRVETGFAFLDWTERLEEFTRRNLWRRAVLEVFDPEIGAQVIEDGACFVGASFDPRGSRVQLMFAAGPDVTQHHTHSIENVTAIQMLRDRGRVDSYLRIGHGRGQTLLTLER